MPPDRGHVAWAGVISRITIKFLAGTIHRQRRARLSGSLNVLGGQVKWQPVGESNPSFQVENLAS